MSRYKKYKMTAISSKFSEKGGYRAQFVADGYSIDARRDILPAAIKETGVQIGEGAAWDLINRFLTMCSNRAATTGETVTVGSLLSFYLAIREWIADNLPPETGDVSVSISTGFGDTDMVLSR